MLAVSLVLFFVALGALASPFYATETEHGSERCTAGAHEGSEASVAGWSWWPLGAPCVLIERDGSRQEEVMTPWGSDAWAEEDL